MRCAVDACAARLGFLRGAATEPCSSCAERSTALNMGERGGRAFQGTVICVCGGKLPHCAVSRRLQSARVRMRVHTDWLSSGAGVAYDL
jgi:hypothetical protein